MAQTKRKRKHRGTAAGTIEARGRTGRAPKPGEVKQSAAQRRQARLDQAPTWRGAINRAAIASLIFAVIAAIVLGHPIGGAIALAALPIALFLPSGYSMDKWLYQRRQKQKQKPKQR